MIRLTPRWLPLLAAIMLLPACTGPSTRPPPVPTTDVEALMAHMTLEQKVAQLVVLGFDGVNYDAGLREMIERYQVGGVIFFARNVESPAQVARLTNALQASALATSGVGLFVAIDQEGGRVARLTAGKGFTEFPGAMAIGATGPAATDHARRVGAAMAAEMKAVGINTDFAPDLDVNNNPANPVIGIRSFSSDPQRVARLGVGFVEGLQSGGVLAFGKHFPGHGDTGTDSHVDLPVVGHPRARLDAVEFVPFKAAIAAGITGIMSAHVSFPAIESTPGLPGTLSHKVLTGLLRNELHFDGLVATDSLEMGALGRSGYPAPRAAARAFAAGADLLLFNSGYELHRAAIEQIVADVKGGATPVARLDEAVRRALRAKARFGLLRPAPVDPAAAVQVCGANAHQTLAAEIAAAAVTLLRDPAGLLPLMAGPTPLVVAVPAATGLAEKLHGTELRVHEQVTSAEARAVLAAVQGAHGATTIVTLAGAGANRSQLDLARKIIATGAPVIFAALREPYDLLPIAEMPVPAGGRAPALVATYGANPPALRALAAVLRGEAKPAGRLPVEMPGLLPLGAGSQDFTRR